MPSATGWWGSSATGVDDPLAIRRAGRELLSLALIDARNALLHALAADPSPPALRHAVRVGWYQEWWLARHLQRARGEGCDRDGARLAGVEPAVDEWLAPGAPPPADAVRAYLARTLEITLDLLAGSAEDDAALFFFRQSVQHEDRAVEALRLAAGSDAPPAHARRDALWLPAQHWRTGGAAAAGFTPWPERGADEAAVPAFDIDAQPVDWGRFAEFVQDGGYDDEACWTAAGWQWVQATGRRAPRGVEQLRDGVVVQRGRGRPQRVPSQQPVAHVTRHEAQAWCRWAGRRLPTEPEWELACARGAGRGFVWGDVLEWTAGRARPWPGAGAPPPGSVDLLDGDGSDSHGVLRGASVVTPRRWHHPNARRFVAAADDRWASGFRSCAL